MNKSLIVISKCAHCGNELKYDEVAWAFGYPFHMLLHLTCAPFYDYDKGYPHNMPLQFYHKKTNLNLEEEVNGGGVYSWNRSTTIGFSDVHH